MAGIILPSFMSVISGQGGASNLPLMSPYELSGVLEWWSAARSAHTQNSDGSGGTPGDGDPIGRVTGRINGNQLIQATAGSKPTYRSTGLLGRPAWEFDGGDFLGCDAIAASFTGDDKPISILFAGRLAVFSSFSMWAALGRSTSAQPFHKFRSTTAGVWHASRRGDSGGATPSQTPGPAQSTNPVALGFRFTGTAGEIWQAGRLVSGPTAMDTVPATFNTFSVGVYRALTNTEFFVGLISEVVVCTAVLSDAEMAAGLNYLAAIDGVV